MEKMYQQYKDTVEFRMIYIKEAHAADSNWSVPYARKKGINNHKNYKERCTTAEMLFKDKSLTIPCLIDNMKNETNTAYQAWPDRVFLVRKDGRLAVAAARGPWGFGPALKQTETWLKKYQKTKKEPALSEEILKAADQRAKDAKKKASKK